ncbi:hypothetical protein PUR61_21600 [Streptomyces sp. BE20]|nr:hypothetical protein [Streptomyces sp. BE20]MEE1824754.1 hypothetical protein [Streptomyces sp. BE20]
MDWISRRNARPLAVSSTPRELLIEERGTDPAFQSLDLLAEARLGYPEFLGSRRNGPRPDHREEIPEVPHVEVVDVLGMTRRAPGGDPRRILRGVTEFRLVQGGRSDPFVQHTHDTPPSHRLGSRPATGLSAAGRWAAPEVRGSHILPKNTFTRVFSTVP